jgi:uncharacterized protein YlxW (UPF0749 family)
VTDPVGRDPAGAPTAGGERAGADPAAPAAPGAPNGRHVARPPHHRLASALIGTLLALLGFALAIQLRSSGTSDGLSGARQEDLVQILEDQNNQEQRLRQQINDLQSASQRLASGADPAAAAAEASARADALGVLTGTLPAKGPGVQASVSDPLNALHAEDLLDLIAELRGAGAEAIQMNQVRVGVDSALTDAPDGAVMMDGQRLSRPFVVLAVGDPKTLDTALNIPGGVASTVRDSGGLLQVTQSQELHIDAIRALPAPSYASPAAS